MEQSSLGQLTTALAKAQSKFKQPELNRTAEIKKDGRTLYTTHYADLNQCIECIREPLTANGLSFVQSVEFIGEDWFLVLSLYHASGESLKSFMPLNMNGSPQVIGGQLTYFKRYQISAFFGLAADFDDDGNAGSNNGNTFEEKPRVEPKKERQPAESIIMPFGQMKGKKLGDIDTETLQKAKLWLRGQMDLKPEPQNIKQIRFIYSQVKEVLKGRGGPPPETSNQDLGPMPEENGLFKDEGDNLVGVSFQGFEHLVQKKIRDLKESEIRALRQQCYTSLQAIPPLSNFKDIAHLRHNLERFLDSMGVKP